MHDSSGRITGAIVGAAAAARAVWPIHHVDVASKGHRPVKI